MEEQIDSLEVLSELKLIIGNLHQELAIKNIQLRKAKEKIDALSADIEESSK